MRVLADVFASAAESVVGTPFRLGGTDPQCGMDCVGVIVFALKAAGLTVPELPAYRLRNHDYAFIASLARRAHLTLTDCAPQRGDVVMVKPGPAQRHLLVALGANSFVHAHAGLGKTVRSDGPLPWPALANFRLTERDRPWQL